MLHLRGGEGQMHLQAQQPQRPPALTRALCCSPCAAMRRQPQHQQPSHHQAAGPWHLSHCLAPQRRHQQQQQQQQHSTRRRVTAHAVGDADPAALPELNLLQHATAKALAFIRAQFLPLALMSGITLGYLFPAVGMAAAELNVPSFATTGIFIVQGLSLRRGEAVKALQSTGSVAYGLLSILLLTPLVALLALQLPLQPPALAFGLAVFCCMPTALSSGVTFTQQVGGNVALALLLTITSNMAGIFTIPFLLPALLGSELGGVQLSPLALLWQLVQTILVPTLVGASVRGFVPGAAQLIDANKRLLSYLSALLLSMVPWMQISKTVSQKVPLDAASIAMAAMAGVCIHLIFLALNTTAARVLQLGGPSGSPQATAIRRAVILVSSVKTLPVAVTVLGKLAPVVGESLVGVAVVPCVLAHLGQILVDSVMVSRWLEADRRTELAAAQGA